MNNLPIAELFIVSISKFLGFYLVILFVRLLLTWFPNIDWMQQIVGFLAPVTDPYLNLFRFVPPIGNIDLSPIIAIFALQFLSQTMDGLARTTMSF